MHACTLVTCCYFVKLKSVKFLKIQFGGVFVKLISHQIFRPYDILVKAPLRVLYNKYSTRGGVEWVTRPQMLYFIIQHEYTVLLLICWFCVGGLLVRFVVKNWMDYCLMRHDTYIHTSKYSNNELNRVVLTRPFSFEAMAS